MPGLCDLVLDGYPLPLLFKPKYPFFLQISVTDRCNLRCKHCYAYLAETEMDYGLFLKLLRDFEELLDVLGVRGTVYLTGGEPMLWPHIFRAIREVRKRRMAPRLLTNGTLISYETARKLKKAGLLFAQVSLDGLRDTHERIRGEGTFDLAIRGIRNLVRAGIQVTVMVTLMRDNRDEVEGIVRLCEGLGVSRVAFQRLVPIGSGKEISDRMLSPKEVAEVMLRLNGMRSKVEIVKREPFWGILLGGVGGCSAGNLGLAVLTDGTVLPCRRLPIPVGNARNDRLIDIYFRNEFIAKLRRRRESACGKCEYVLSCYGCRGVAYAVTGDPFARDPQCPLEFLRRGKPSSFARETAATGDEKRL